MPHRLNTVGPRTPAQTHQCIDCGSQAYHWSYDHDAPDEMYETIGKYLVAYSPSQEHYAPRCVPCHKRFDLDRIDGTPDHMSGGQHPLGSPKR